MAASEVDALKAVDDALKDLNDVAACERILRWAWARYVPAGSAPSQPSSSAPSERPAPGLSRKGGKGRRPAGRAVKKNESTSRKPRTISIVRDLNLRPKGKKSFGDFVAEKQPSSNFERCAVAVYYLKNEAGIDAVTPSHVFTCFKDAHWRVPSDLANALALTAHRKGWVDTRDMDSLTVTTHGENLIEHDLPRKAKV